MTKRGLERPRRPAPDAPPEGSLARSDLRDFGAEWVREAESLSPATHTSREATVRLLLWFLESIEAKSLGPAEVERFKAYCALPAEERWGMPTRAKRPTPSTVFIYFQRVKALCRYMARRWDTADPTEKLTAPTHRPDPIRPLSLDQIEALLGAAKASRYPRRDTALVLMLFDTGIRAAEACALRVSDVDLRSRTCIVRRGKGGKTRVVHFSNRTAQALAAYLRASGREPEDALWGSERVDALRPCGLSQLIERLGAAAGITGVRCSPHTLRHSCATEFLRSGGNVFALKELLGHSTLAMTNRYVAVSQADLEAQHRRHSPVERLSAKKGGRLG